jgi:hypothetical protein
MATQAPGAPATTGVRLRRSLRLSGRSPARKGRAFRSLDTLLIRHGGRDVATRQRPRTRLSQEVSRVSPRGGHLIQKLVTHTGTPVPDPTRHQVR